MFFFTCTKTIWPWETDWKCRSLFCSSWYLWSVSLFIFIVCVRPLGSLLLCSSLLSPGEEHPEAELAAAAQPKWKAFPARQWNRRASWFSLSTQLPLRWQVRAAQQAPGAAAPHSSQEKLHLLPFPSKPTAHQGQLVFLRPYCKPSKSQACCMFSFTLWGMIYCLTRFWAAALLGRGRQLRYPSQTDTPWVAGPGIHRTCWGRSWATSSSRTMEQRWFIERRLLLPTLVCSQQQGQAEVTHWSDSEVTCDGVHIWQYLLFWPELLWMTSWEEQPLWGVPQHWWELWGCLRQWGDFTSLALWHTPPCYLLESTSGRWSPHLKPCVWLEPSPQAVCVQSTHRSTAGVWGKEHPQQRCGKQSHLWPWRMALSLSACQSRSPVCTADCGCRHVCHHPLQVTPPSLFCLSHFNLLLKGSQVNSYDELD